MPTRKEREYYAMGFRDGLRASQRPTTEAPFSEQLQAGARMDLPAEYLAISGAYAKPKKRKLSAWQRFVKANSKKPRFRYKSGAKRGKINLKALGVAYRKKKRR